MATIYQKYHNKFNSIFNYELQDLKLFTDAALDEWRKYLIKRIPSTDIFPLYYYTRFFREDEAGNEFTINVNKKITPLRVIKLSIGSISTINSLIICKSFKLQLAN